MEIIRFITFFIGCLFFAGIFFTIVWAIAKTLNMINYKLSDIPRAFSLIGISILESPRTIFRIFLSLPFALFMLVAPFIYGIKPTGNLLLDAMYLLGWLLGSFINGWFFLYLGYTGFITWLWGLFAGLLICLWTQNSVGSLDANGFLGSEVPYLITVFGILHSLPHLAWRWVMCVKCRIQTKCMALSPVFRWSCSPCQSSFGWSSIASNPYILTFLQYFIIGY